MAERKNRRDPRTEEIIKAFDRERETAREFHRRHTDATRDSRWRDRQVFIERRQKPR
jgi:hypothetical protein